MSSDSDCAAAIVLAIAVKRKKKRSERKKRVWCKDLYKKREDIACQTIFLKELEFTSANDFKNYVHMNKESFDEILNKIQHRITKRDTPMRIAIPSHHRLSITLRFLTSGNTYQTLKNLTGIAPQTIGNIVIDTCDALIIELKDFIKLPQTQNEWRKEASHFNDRWNFPHCLGAINGKHLHIIQPPGTGAFYLNSENNYSVVLMAIVNANYEFLMVDVGTDGRDSDVDIDTNSKFFSMLESETLDIPDPEPLPGSKENFPFVFVGDDAFPLWENIMKPFRHNKLNKKEIVFNNRLSRAHSIVDNTFDILSSRFKVLLNTFTLPPQKVTTIALACCYLHNFLQSKNDSNYFDEAQHLQSLYVSDEEDATSQGKTVREKYCNYFNMEKEVPLPNNI